MNLNVPYKRLSLRPGYLYTSGMGKLKLKE